MVYPIEKDHTTPEDEHDSSIGIYDETDPLRRVMIWGPPGAEAYLAQLYPETESLFLGRMDVPTARHESHAFAETLESHGVDVVRARDLLAEQLDPSRASRDQVLKALFQKATRIHDAHPNRPEVMPEVIEQLLDRDIRRYGPEAALALNTTLSLTPAMPLGNAIYSCDQMKIILGRRVQAQFRYPIRRPEVELYESIYSQLGIGDPIIMPEGETFEGGDLYIHNGVVYIGVGARTSQGAALHMYQELESSLREAGYEFAMVVDHEHEERPHREQMDYMHLDTWSEPLDKHTVMLFPDEARRRRVYMVERRGSGKPHVVAAKKDYIKFLEDRGDTILEVPSTEQQSFGLNNLSLDPDLVAVSIDTNLNTLARLSEAGKRTIPLSLFQTTRGYGAAHCMTAQLLRSPRK